MSDDDADSSKPNTKHVYKSVHALIHIFDDHLCTGTLSTSYRRRSARAQKCTFRVVCLLRLMYGWLMLTMANTHKYTRIEMHQTQTYHQTILPVPKQKNATSSWPQVITIAIYIFYLRDDTTRLNLCQIKRLETCRKRRTSRFCIYIYMAHRFLAAEFIRTAMNWLLSLSHYMPMAES